jgi:membrane peptidoglycan carboxypeptidase
VLRAVYRDGRRYPITPKIVRRTISAETAATLTTIMEAVVTDGTAKLAQIGGYTIAGKTGTASKLIDGRYSASENNASFAGFLPSRNPAVTIVVVIDAPHAGGSTGGVVAAPIFKRIAGSPCAISASARRSTPSRQCSYRHDPVDVGTQLRSGPIVSLVSDLPGTVPNRMTERPRSGSNAGRWRWRTPRATASSTTESSAGAALEPGAVCSLVLNRWAARGEQVVGP